MRARGKAQPDAWCPGSCPLWGGVGQRPFPFTYASPVMDQNPQNNIHGHYAPHNREEMGLALSHYEHKLGAEEFSAMFDAYDKNMHSSVLAYNEVPRPIKMLRKLKARNTEKALEEGRSECCDLLNHLTTLLPSM